MVGDVEVGFTIGIWVGNDLQDRMKCQVEMINCGWCWLFVDDLD